MSPHSNVGYWHIADISDVGSRVRCRGNNEHAREGRNRSLITHCVALITPFRSKPRSFGLDSSLSGDVNANEVSDHTPDQDSAKQGFVQKRELTGVVADIPSWMGYPVSVTYCRIASSVTETNL